MNRCALAHIEIDSVGGEAQIITGGGGELETEVL